MEGEELDFEVQFGGFDRLMEFRVRKILLVASPYDAFIIAEDDRLTELIFSEYLGLNLRYAPRVTRVSTASEALECLRGDPFDRTPFDLVLTMMRVGDMEPAAFADAAKRANPDLPVILLAHHILDVQRLRSERSRAIDRAFLWTGNARILLSIIKQIEDRRNIEHDIDAAGVHMILLVEDSVRYYSHFLPMLYTEMLDQTRRHMSDALNLSHKMLRMRARPKILLACSYEEAWELYSKYKSHMLGIITDIQFPREGRLDPEAGLRLIERVKKEASDIPTLLQSSDERLAARAGSLGASFIHKGSSSLLADLRNFIVEQLGFADFIFRLPGGEEVGRAQDLPSLLEQLKTVPDASVEYHASHNHFSKWLMARTEFELAYKIRPRKISEFGEIRLLRRYLAYTISRFLQKSQTGVIADFTERHFNEASPFVRIGSGSLGGKGRGLAFLNSLYAREDPSRRWPGIRVVTPNTAVLPTDAFDEFLKENGLLALITATEDDEAVRRAFLAAPLPERVQSSLAAFLDKIRHPLAVRSSSLLEDSQVKPLAGIYETYMIPNNHPDPALRLEQLSRAVRLVYASTFSAQARAYLSAAPHLRDEEKMAVVIQQLVGKPYGGRFYPDFSGLAQSYNYYPVAPFSSEEGVAYATLGLGRAIVEGGRALAFCPAHPEVLFQFSSVKESLANSQREFRALDLGRRDYLPERDPAENLLTLELAAAESDGALAALGSCYSPENDRIYDGISRPGPRLVSFAGLLKGGSFPLPEILRYLLRLGEKAVGCPIEIEFAGTLEPAEFHVLQIRPMLSWSAAEDVRLEEGDRARAVCLSAKALGHGKISDIRDLLYVKPAAFIPGRTRPIAEEIGVFNARLKAEGRPYALIGPGRWGSTDQSLGIPVLWSQIAGAKLIVETSLEDFAPEPSYGTHFLHNVVSSGIGYLTVEHGASEGAVDWGWLDAAPAIEETRHLRLLRTQTPFDVRIDGRKREGAILRP